MSLVSEHSPAQLLPILAEEPNVITEPRKAVLVDPSRTGDLLLFEKHFEVTQIPEDVGIPGRGHLSDHIRKRERKSHPKKE